jgi:hypothetical protein
MMMMMTLNKPRRARGCRLRDLYMHNGNQSNEHFCNTRVKKEAYQQLLRWNYQLSISDNCWYLLHLKTLTADQALSCNSCQCLYLLTSVYIGKLHAELIMTGIQCHYRSGKQSSLSCSWTVCTMKKFPYGGLAVMGFSRVCHWWMFPGKLPAAQWTRSCVLINRRSVSKERTLAKVKIQRSQNAGGFKSLLYRPLIVLFKTLIYIYIYIYIYNWKHQVNVANNDLGVQNCLLGYTAV